MKRILVYGLSNQWGGVESIVHSIIDCLEDEIFFDIIISGDNIDSRHYNHAHNVSILRIPAWGESRSHFKSNLKKIFSRNEYDFVWINASLMSNRDIISVALKNSNASIITHSHGSYFEETYKLKEYILLTLHYLNRSYFKKHVKFKCMCSKLSGKWFYGKKLLKTGNIHLVRNGISTAQFVFNASKRAIMRSNLGINDEVALFHVGRLTAVKNQSYLLDIVKESIRQRLNVKLFIAGGGELRPILEKKVDEMGLKEQVVFLGPRSDVDQLYQACDVFLLPSFHEGFPVTLTEAQTSGLPCIVSDTISRETNINGRVEYLPIDFNSIKLWVEAIKSNLVTPEERAYLGENVKKAHFDIEDVAEDFKKFLKI